MTCSHHSWTFQLTQLAKLCHIYAFFFSRCLVQIGLVQQMPRCTSFEPVSFDGFGCAQTKTIMKIHTARHLQWYCTSLSLSLACFVLEQRPLVALSQSLLDPAYGSHLSSRLSHAEKRRRKRSRSTWFGVLQAHISTSQVFSKQQHPLLNLMEGNQ